MNSINVWRVITLHTSMEKFRQINGVRRFYVQLKSFKQIMITKRIKETRLPLGIQKIMLYVLVVMTKFNEEDDYYILKENNND
jgi:hypothetical protein